MKTFKALLFSAMFFGVLFVPSAFGQCNYSIDSNGVADLLGECEVYGTHLLPEYVQEIRSNGHAIIGVAPMFGRFIGPIVMNSGVRLTWHNPIVKSLDLNDNGNCLTGDSRLRGVLLQDMEYIVIKNGDVSNINLGENSTCQEGTAFEINTRNIFARTMVDIQGLNLSNFQVGGLVINNNVQARAKNFKIGQSATQWTTPANSLQVAFGATFEGSNCQIALNSNKTGARSASSTGAVFALSGAGSYLENCVMMDGNAEIGVAIFTGTSGLRLENLKIRESGDDGPSAIDRGISDLGTGNQLINNKITGFAVEVFPIVAAATADSLRMAATPSAEPVLN